jgi:hypothetical protein
MLTNKPMAGWKIVLLVWVVGGAICTAVRDAAGDGPAFTLFGVILIGTSTYLYSKRCTAFVNRLLARFNLI